MSDKELADIVCRALLAIVAGIRRKYGLPEYHNVIIQITDTFAGVTSYDKIETPAMVEHPGA